jgi:hypothetical protein
MQKILFQEPNLAVNMDLFMHPLSYPVSLITPEKAQLPVWIKTTMFNPSSLVERTAWYSIAIFGILFFNLCLNLILKALAYLFISINT